MLFGRSSNGITFHQAHASNTLVKTMPYFICSLKLRFFLLTFFQDLADIAIYPALFLPANRCTQCPNLFFKG